MGWAPPAQRHGPNTTAVLHVWWLLQHTKRDPHATQTTVCHQFLLKSRQPTHHLHRPFRTPKWALQVKVLPRWVSKDSAFPDHPSVNSNNLCTDLQHTTHIINPILWNVPLYCQYIQWKPAKTVQSQMTYGRYSGQHTGWHLLCSICCWCTMDTRWRPPLASPVQVKSWNWECLKCNAFILHNVRMSKTKACINRLAKERRQNYFCSMKEKTSDRRKCFSVVLTVN